MQVMRPADTGPAVITVTVTTELAGRPLTCGRCQMTWTVSPKPDGTWPQGSRCPVARGGCGTWTRLTRPADPLPDPTPAARTAGRGHTSPAAWDPPGSPARPRATAEVCPECGTGLHATVRGTRRACLSCRRAVTPAGVAAPYERGGSGQRQVRSSRERDLDAIALARRKGLMLDQLAVLAADKRLHEQDRPVVEWFAEQVRAAAGQPRLDELAGLLPQAGIRRRHWWDAEPRALAAGIGTGPDDDDPDDGEWDDGDPDDDPGIGGRETAPAPDRGRPAGITWAGALAAAGWRLSPSPGGCQVIGQDGQRCGDPGAIHHVSARPVGDAWICARHHEHLSVIITRGAA